MTPPRAIADGDLYDVYCGAPLASGGHVLAMFGCGWRRVAVHRVRRRWLGVIDTASLRAATIDRAAFAVCRPSHVADLPPTELARLLERRRRWLARTGAATVSGKHKRPTRRRIQQIAKAFRP